MYPKFLNVKIKAVIGMNIKNITICNKVDFIILAK